MEQTSNSKTFLAILALGLFALVAFGLIWFFFLGPDAPVGLGWYLFSFASGLTMIVLPCTLPLAFVIVPLAMGKSAGKGLAMALAFGVGVALMLSVYGVLAAVVGEVAIGTLGAPLEVVKNWLYFIAGAFAFVFALGEIGLVRFRMPTYTGAAPAFIQQRRDILKALLLGLFLGNVGVGCPHPATPVILTRIAASGDVFYGWMLFLVHAIGRVLPLLLLAVLAILGVNALTWLVARKERIERATGWGMVFVAGFILVLGLFTHDWWVYSGQHTLLESVTQEERFLGAIIDRFNLAGLPHTHDIPSGRGLFGLPLWLGSWALVGLWAVPMWWYYLRKRVQGAGYRPKVEASGLQDCEQVAENRVQPWRFWFFLSLTLLLGLTFIYVLPDRFLYHRGMHMEQGMMMEEMHEDEHRDAHGEEQYHEEGDVPEGLVVNLNVTPIPATTNNPVTFDFFVNEKPGGIPVSAEELELDHEKLMHVVGVRNDLEEFFHIHPSPSQISEGNLGGQVPGLFSIAHTFTKPGLYKLWSEIKKDGTHHSFGHPEINVEGEGETYKKEVYFGRSVIVGNYQILLDYEEPLAKGKETDLTFDIHDVVGRETEVEPYLGAEMHLAVIKDDLTQFIHTHPSPSQISEGNLGGQVHTSIPRAYAHGTEEDVDAPLEEEVSSHGINFHVTFPEAGTYRVFAQFRPKGIDLPAEQALTASFWLEVEEVKPFAIPKKILLTVISVTLIALLSWGTKRYLTVKAQKV
jgi:cytochrome c-type biogenesis protein